MKAADAEVIAHHRTAVQSIKTDAFMSILDDEIFNTLKVHIKGILQSNGLRTTLDAVREAAYDELITTNDPLRKQRLNRILVIFEALTEELEMCNACIIELL